MEVTMDSLQAYVDAQLSTDAKIDLVQNWIQGRIEAHEVFGDVEGSEEDFLYLTFLYSFLGQLQGKMPNRPPAVEHGKTGKCSCCGTEAGISQTTLYKDGTELCYECIEGYDR